LCVNIDSIYIKQFLRAFRICHWN